MDNLPVSLYLEKEWGKNCGNNCVNSETDWKLNTLELFHTTEIKARACLFDEDTTVLSCPRAEKSPCSECSWFSPLYNSTYTA